MEHLLCYLSALTSKKCLFLDHVSPEFQWLLWSQTGVLTPRSECFFFPYVSLREGGGEDTPDGDGENIYPSGE